MDLEAGAAPAAPASVHTASGPLPAAPAPLVLVTEPPLTAGSRVRLGRLVTRPGLNGRTGVILGLARPDDRLPVRLEPMTYGGKVVIPSETIAVKLTNLDLFDDS